MILIVFFNLDLEVDVRRFLSGWMLIGGLMVAGGANATPVEWTLTPVIFPNSSTLSGWFTYDSDTNSYTNINLGYFDNQAQQLYFLSNVAFGDSSRLIISTNGQSGDPAADLLGFTPAISNTGGSVSLTAYVGTFNGINVNQVSNSSATVTAPLTPTPTITSINPTSGPAAGGTTVTIQGNNLCPTPPPPPTSTQVITQGATYPQVTIGGSVCNVTSCNSSAQPASVQTQVNGHDSEIVCTTTAHPAGATDVAVTTAGGVATLPNGFTYSAPTPLPAPIPTLSEWAQIIMMLLMIATVGFYGWRMKQR